MRGGAKVSIEKHRHSGVFIAKGGKDDALVTRNVDPGNSSMEKNELQLSKKKARLSIVCGTRSGRSWPRLL